MGETLAYRNSFGQGALLLALVGSFIAAMGAHDAWRHGHVRVAVGGGIAGALVLLGALLAWVFGHGQVRWDSDGLTVFARGRTRSLRWSEIQTIEVCASSTCHALYTLRAPGGQLLVIDGEWLGDQGGQFMAELRRRVAPFLASQCRLADGPGLVAPAGPESGAMVVGLVLLFLMAAAMAGYGAVALREGLREPGCWLLGVGLVGLVGAVRLWRRRARGLRLGPEGLCYGTRGDNCLPWGSIELVELRRVAGRGPINESTVVRAPGVSVWLYATSPTYLAARAVLRAKAISAKFVDRAQCRAPDDWRCLLDG